MIRALLVLSLVAAAGCAQLPPHVWVADLPGEPQPKAPLIQPRDAILVEVRDQAALTGEFPVREDGYYMQPTVGNLPVAGKTCAEAAFMLQGRLKDVVVNPRVTVFIAKPAPVKVSVVGEVKTPGTYELQRDRSVLAALALAGWVTEFAHDDRVFVVRKEGGERVRFRVRDLTAAERAAIGFRLRDGDAVVVE